MIDLGEVDWFTNPSGVLVDHAAKDGQVLGERAHADLDHIAETSGRARVLHGELLGREWSVLQRVILGQKVKFTF